MALSDKRLPQLFKYALGSFGIWQSVDGYFVTDVSGEPVAVSFNF
jgi:hypothetical protein